MNPKSPGTRSYDRFNRYRKATTVGEYLDAGGFRADLRWDRAHGYVILIGDDAAAVAAEHPVPPSYLGLSYADHSIMCEREEKERRSARKEAQRAELISRNVDDVSNVLNAVNDALASGMAWDDLESMIHEEKRRGNPVAKFISSLDLKNNQVTIKLAPKEDVEIDETTGEEVVVKL